MVKHKSVYIILIVLLTILLLTSIFIGKDMWYKVGYNEGKKDGMIVAENSFQSGEETSIESNTVVESSPGGTEEPATVESSLGGTKEPVTVESDGIAIGETYYIIGKDYIEGDTFNGVAVSSELKKRLNAYFEDSPNIYDEDKNGDRIDAFTAVSIAYGIARSTERNMSHLHFIVHNSIKEKRYYVSCVEPNLAGSDVVYIINKKDGKVFCMLFGEE